MSALTDKLAAYGCNIDEAMGRFLNNEAFYAKCYGKFVADKSFARLGEALQAGDVKGAFEAARVSPKNEKAINKGKLVN